jgi:hypothetical protein
MPPTHYVCVETLMDALAASRQKRPEGDVSITLTAREHRFPDNYVLELHGNQLQLCSADGSETTLDLGGLAEVRGPGGLILTRVHIKGVGAQRITRGAMVDMTTPGEAPDVRRLQIESGGQITIHGPLNQHETLLERIEDRRRAIAASDVSVHEPQAAATSQREPPKINNAAMVEAMRTAMLLVPAHGADEMSSPRTAAPDTPTGERISKLVLAGKPDGSYVSPRSAVGEVVQQTRSADEGAIPSPRTAKKLRKKDRKTKKNEA